MNPWESYLSPEDRVTLARGKWGQPVRDLPVDHVVLHVATGSPASGDFDRIPLSHAVALFDMNRTYADVLPTSEVVAYLRGLAGPMPDGPSTDPRSTARLPVDSCATQKG